MSPVKKASDAVNLELSSFWVGLTHFVQQTGALGLLAVTLIWGVPKILEERKDREAIEGKLETYMIRIDGFMSQLSENMKRLGEQQRRGHDL